MEIKLGKETVDLEQLAIQARALSPEQKEDRLCDELEQILAVAYNRRKLYRNWSPWAEEDVPTEQIKRYPIEKDSTLATILEGFAGIENYVGDYVKGALQGYRTPATRTSMIRTRLQTMWGDDEMRHGVALEQVLVHSGARTRSQLRDYNQTLLENHEWQTTDQPGMDNPRTGSAYGDVQERGTYVSYLKSIDLVIVEYKKLDDAPTLEGLEAKKQEAQYNRTGAAEVLRIIGQDEIGHHGVYTGATTADLRYYPLETLRVLKEVLVEHFHMPNIRRLPKRRDFFAALRSTQLLAGEVFEREVERPILRTFGFNNRSDLDAAIYELERFEEKAA